MDVILDESSLRPCSEYPVVERIKTLAKVLVALDHLGCSKALRSVRSAPDQDIGDAQGLRRWCFKSESGDAGRLIALRLGKQPYIDGEDGLFSRIEGQQAIEGLYNQTPALGLTYAALTNAPAVAMQNEPSYGASDAFIEITTLDEQGTTTEKLPVIRLETEAHIAQQRQLIMGRIESSVSNGSELLKQANTLFPHLRFGAQAERQIKELTGNEPVFHQLFRHLRALNGGTNHGATNNSFQPAEAISWSTESNPTLSHRTYGPMRDFPVPDGFAPFRWSDHSKLSGGSGTRLYFSPKEQGDKRYVLIGYFGKHLPTVSEH